LIDHAAQQIFLLFFELRVDLILRAALTIARCFVAQLLFGFLICREGDDVVVYARNDFSVGRGLGLRAGARRNERREERQSADSDDRWNAICEIAAKLGIRMRQELVVQLIGVDPTPNLGYPFAKQLLARKQPFTALFAYNDISAIGSICAFQEAGLQVPDDISVVGFDDIQSAAYITPPLTTVRQPLLKVGEIAARSLLDRIEARTKYVSEIVIEPELIVRKSTGRPRS